MTGKAYRPEPHATSRARVAAALALAVVSGCARLPPPDLSRDPAGLLGQVRAAQARVTSVRGPASVTLESPGQSGSLDAFVAAEKPDRIRVELLDFFGNPAMVMAAGAGRFAVLDLRAAVFYRGEATPENLSKFLPVRVPVSDLVTLLCGSAPLLDGSAAEAAEPDGEAMRLELEGPGGREFLWVGAGATVRAATLEPRTGGAGSFWRVAFASFAERGGALWPAEADLRSASARLTLHWKRGAEVNAASSPAAFALEPPRGVRVVDLSGGEVPSLDLPVRPGEGTPAG